MSIDRYYHLCCKHQGKAVVIRTRDRRIHRGIISNVNRNRVYIRPFKNERNLGGFGYGFGGFGGPGRFGGFAGYGGFGFGYGIALGTIIGLSLSSLLFW